MAEGGLKRFNSDQAGAKVGAVHGAFGDPGKPAIVYDLSPVPMTLKIRGKGADLAFEGPTKDGIARCISAQCNDVDAM